MRVIAGSARGRPLAAPRGDATRPILDIQKESLFNVLQDRFPCGGVLDVFAGSGSLGIEALSRGAAQATFFERAFRAAEVVRANLRACGFEDRAKVVVRDAFALDPARLAHPVGAAFFDPPFPLYREKPGRIHELIATIATQAEIEEGAVFVLRVPRDAEVPPFGAPLVETDRRAAGESVIVLLEKARSDRTRA